jgi:CheY-like chemotaxis protein
MKILIVEDDKVISLLLQKMVERMDYVVIETATKGHEAVDKIQNLKIVCLRIF